MSRLETVRTRSGHLGWDAALRKSQLLANQKGHCFLLLQGIIAAHKPSKLVLPANPIRIAARYPRQSSLLSPML